MKEIGSATRQEIGRWLNNRAETSHQPFRRRERAMAKLRSAKSLQKFNAFHASVHNHFNQERDLTSRESYKFSRSPGRMAATRGLRHADFGVLLTDPYSRDIALRALNMRPLVPETLKQIGSELWGWTVE